MIACHDLNAMLKRRGFLKPPVKEYEQNYLRLNRQALFDRCVLDSHLQEVAKQGRRRTVPTMPAQLLEPPGVAQLILDRKEFPELAEFLTNFNSRDSEFREGSQIDNAYETVKQLLRANAGIRPKRRA